MTTPVSKIKNFEIDITQCGNKCSIFGKNTIIFGQISHIGFNLKLHVCDGYNKNVLSIAIPLTAEALRRLLMRLKHNSVAKIASGNWAIS